MAQEPFPTVLMIMLCLRCALGGAEKEYARIFEMLVDRHPRAAHRLLINRDMLDLLQAAGLLTQRDAELIVLVSPLRRLQSVTHSTWLLGSRLIRRFLGGLDVLWYTWQCWRVIRQCQPDIVHPLLTGVYFSLPALVLRSKQRYTMSAYSYQFESYRDKRILGISVGATAKRFAMQKCDAIDALTGAIGDDLASRGIDADKVYVAPCAFTDVSLCQPSRQKEKWVVFLARFAELKNPLLLARAVPLVLAHVPDAHFYFLGEGDLLPQLEALLGELGVAEHCTVRFEPRPTEILNRSSVFVSLQAEENYPSQSLLEAMACGNAIVATEVGETWRLVDETNGILVLPTVDAVAAAIVRLLNAPNVAELGYASRQRVLTEHTAERFFKYMTDVYRAVAKG